MSLKWMFKNRNDLCINFVPPVGRRSSTGQLNRLVLLFQSWPWNKWFNKSKSSCVIPLNSYHKREFLISSSVSLEKPWSTHNSKLEIYPPRSALLFIWGASSELDCSCALWTSAAVGPDFPIARKPYLAMSLYLDWGVYIRKCRSG